MPELYGKAYEKTEKSDSHKLLYFDYARYAPRLVRYIKERGYDVVFCVHEFPAIMLSAVRKHQKLDIRQYFVATDYTFTPGLEMTEMDGWFVPQGLKADFAANGIPGDKIFEAGIPVDPVFCNNISKQDARKKLGVRDDMEVILLAAGSIGCGPIKDLAENLHKRGNGKTVTVVICGNNKKLQKELAANVKDALCISLGFVDNISDWLAAADVLITKPGGLSVTEAATTGIPMVLVDAVPGLETHNRNYLTKYGCAYTADTTEGLLDMTEQALLDGKLMVSAQRSVFRENAVCKMIDTIVNQPDIDAVQNS